MRREILILFCAIVCAGCNRPSKVEQYRSEKHVRDSVSLVNQQRTLAYYQTVLDSLLPVSDSLLQYFRYERDERYQDHGYYVVKEGRMKMPGRRILVRDDGKEVLCYREGKRIEDEKEKRKDEGAYALAEHLQIVIRDIKELEKRITRTSLEVQKYQKRL